MLHPNSTVFNGSNSLLHIIEMNIFLYFVYKIIPRCWQQTDSLELFITFWAGAKISILFVHLRFEVVPSTPPM